MTWYVLLLAGALGIVIFVGTIATLFLLGVTLANWKLVYRNERIHYIYRRVVLVGLPLAFWGGVLCYYIYSMVC
jgi:hypothetical protein